MSPFMTSLGLKPGQARRTLLADAAASGGSCVKGQSPPKKLVDLTQLCIFRHPNSSVLIHRGTAMPTRLDGEY